MPGVVKIVWTLILALLAAHWAWSGAVYHWLYFRPINPAAAVFAAGFVVQALVFAWLAWTARGQVPVPEGGRGTARRRPGALRPH